MRNKNRNPNDYYLGYRYPKILIGHVVWLYHRFMLSLRDVWGCVEESPEVAGF